MSVNEEPIAALDFEKPIYELEQKIVELKSSASELGADIAQQLIELEEKSNKLKMEIYGALTPWQKVQIARHPKRPYTLDYIKNCFTDFVELHGDRAFADDKSIICGMAKLGSHQVAVIGHQKGRGLHDNIDRNFAMANPEGYRKALRIMKLAEKFNRPIITFIDTPGAYPGIGAEERGQAEAIARNLREMSILKVPVISVVIGEGGSGGAVGIGVANCLLMLENAYYSVISPEGCAAILFRDAAKAIDAANALKITAKDLYELKIVDEVIVEPLGGAHKDMILAASNVKEALERNLAKLLLLDKQILCQTRYDKYRAIGEFTQEKLIS